MAFTEKELRQMVKDAGVRMLEENLVQGTWGNISIRLDEKHALVTPSGLDYVVMTPDDLPVVDIETLEWTGPRKPTSERKIHAAILRARPEINVVLHSHPTWGATFASTHLSLPAFNDKMKSIFWATSVVQSTALQEPKNLRKIPSLQWKAETPASLQTTAFSCAENLGRRFRSVPRSGRRLQNLYRAKDRRKGKSRQIHDRTFAGTFQKDL